MIFLETKIFQLCLLPPHSSIVSITFSQPLFALSHTSTEYNPSLVAEIRVLMLKQTKGLHFYQLKNSCRIKAFSPRIFHPQVKTFAHYNPSLDETNIFSSKVVVRRANRLPLEALQESYYLGIQMKVTNTR